MKVNNPKYVTYYIDENFEFILTQIHNCYRKMLVKYDFIENNENKIKNRLYRDFLNNQSIIDELKLNGYRFKTETGFVDENYNEVGYSDIEIIDLIGSLKNIESFYIIECKRIDGLNSHYQSSLNNKYINDGINRFIEEKYPTNNKVNGMLGFVVKEIDIKENSTYFTDLNSYKFIDDFEFSYKSNHITKSNKKITLYHLMLDYSSKINPTSN
jgi:hypothetical protein